MSDTQRKAGRRLTGEQREQVFAWAIDPKRSGDLILREGAAAFHCHADTLRRLLGAVKILRTPGFTMPADEQAFLRDYGSHVAVSRERMTFHYFQGVARDLDTWLKASAMGQPPDTADHDPAKPLAHVADQEGAADLARRAYPYAVQLEGVTHLLPGIRGMPTLARIHTGVELGTLLAGASLYSLKNEPLATEAERDLVAEFADMVTSDADAVKELAAIGGAGFRVRFEFTLQTAIEGLAAAGFWVFGAGDVQQYPPGSPTATAMNRACVAVFRATNPDIFEVPAWMRKTTDAILNAHRDRYWQTPVPPRPGTGLDEHGAWDHSRRRHMDD